MTPAGVIARAKPWLTSKTILFGLLAVIVGVLQQLLDLSLIPAAHVGWVVAAIGLVNAVLRIRTKQPLSRSPVEVQARIVDAAPPGAPRT